MKPIHLAMLAALGIGAYYLTKGIGAVAGAAGAALSSTQNALASGLYALFGPTENFGPDLDYIVTFPNGARHSIGADVVGNNGQFTYYAPPLAATTWQMLVGQDGLHYAAPVT